MKIITKENVKNLILSEIDSKFLDDNNLSKFFNNLYNIESDEVYPLNKIETFVLRKRLGVLDNGKVISKVEIASIIEMSPPSVTNIYKKSMFKVINYIKLNDKKNDNIKLTSLDNLDNKSEFENILIVSLNIDTQIMNRLSKYNILTLNDLLGYSLIELEDMIGISSALQLDEVISKMGLRFLDKLQISDRLEIFQNASLDVINNSSAYWLFDLAKVNKTVVSKSNAKNIKEYFTKLETLPVEIKRRIISLMLPLKYIIIDNQNKKNK